MTVIKPPWAGAPAGLGGVSNPGTQNRRGVLRADECSSSLLQRWWNDPTLSDREVMAVVAAYVTEISKERHPVVHAQLDFLLRRLNDAIEIASLDTEPAPTSRGYLVERDCPAAVLRRMWNSPHISDRVVLDLLDAMIRKINSTGGGAPSGSSRLSALRTQLQVSMAGSAEEVSQGGADPFAEFYAFDTELAAHVAGGSPAWGEFDGQRPVATDVEPRFGPAPLMEIPDEIDLDELNLDEIDPDGFPVADTARPLHPGDLYTPPVEFRVTGRFSPPSGQGPQGHVRVVSSVVAGSAPPPEIVPLHSIRDEALGIAADLRAHIGHGMALVSSVGAVITAILQNGRVGPEADSIDWGAKASAFLEGAFRRERRERAEGLSRNTRLSLETRTELQALIRSAGIIEMLLVHIYHPILREMIKGREGIDYVTAMFTASDDADRGAFAYSIPQAEELAGRLKRVHAWIEANAPVAEDSFLGRYRRTVDILKKTAAAAEGRNDFDTAGKIAEIQTILGVAVVDALHIIVGGETSSALTNLNCAFEDVIEGGQTGQASLLSAIGVLGAEAEALKKNLTADGSGLVSGAEAVFGDLLERSAGNDALRKIIEGYRTSSAREHMPNLLKNILGRRDWKAKWRDAVARTIADVMKFLDGAGVRLHEAGLEVARRAPPRPSGLLREKGGAGRAQLSRDDVNDVLADARANMEAGLLWFAGKGEAVAESNWAGLAERIRPWFESGDIARNPPLLDAVSRLYDTVIALREASGRIHSRFEGRPSAILGTNPLPHRLAVEIAASLLGADGLSGHIQKVSHLFDPGARTAAGTAERIVSSAGWGGPGRAGRVRTAPVQQPLLAALYELRTRVQALARQGAMPTRVLAELSALRGRIIDKRLSSYQGSAVGFALVRVAEDLDRLLINFSKANISALILDTAGPLRGSLLVAIELLEREGGGGPAGSGQAGGGHGTTGRRNAGRMWDRLSPAHAGACVFAGMQMNPPPPMGPWFVPPPVVHMFAHL